jgi:AraC-like DNA-binding protein
MTLVMGLSKYLPNEQLSGSIEYFFTLELERKNISIERILPSVSDAFILNFGSPLYGQNGQEFFEFPRCFIHKTDKKPRNIKFNHQVKMVGVVFKSGMVSNFTKSSIVDSSLINFSEFLIDPILIFGDEINWLFEAAKEMKSLSDSINVVEQFFIKIHQENRPGLNLLKKATMKISASYGRVSISTVSKSTNLKDRYLRKLFSLHVGISPKRYGEIIRIRKALSLILYDKYSISEAAFFLEYHDLAHFSHSFKRIIGASPKHYFSENNEINHLFLTPNMHEEVKQQSDFRSWLKDLFF